MRAGGLTLNKELFFTCTSKPTGILALTVSQQLIDASSSTFKSQFAQTQRNFWLDSLNRESHSICKTSNHCQQDKFIFIWILNWHLRKVSETIKLLGLTQTNLYCLLYDIHKKQRVVSTQVTDHLTLSPMNQAFIFGTRARLWNDSTSRCANAWKPSRKI